MVYCTRIVIILAILLNVDDVHLAPVLQDDFNIWCRATIYDTEVWCYWQTPASLGENDTCTLWYMITPGHPHFEWGCDSYSNWTKCEFEEVNSCYFPTYPPMNSAGEFRSSVFGSCGPDIDMKIQCSDGQSSDVLTVNNFNVKQTQFAQSPYKASQTIRDMTGQGICPAACYVGNLSCAFEWQTSVPDGVENVNVTGTGFSEVTVTWEKPSSWGNIDGLVFVIEYWQEYSDDDDRYQIDLQNKDPVYSEIIHEHLTYADAVTCVRVACYFRLNPLRTLSDWSNDSCTKTLMDAPREARRNIQVQNISVDWEEETRIITIMWDPIPVHLQGGPILEYTISMCEITAEGGCLTPEVFVSNETYYTLELDALSSYKIYISARNEVGKSDSAEFTIKALTPPSESSPFYYVGIAVALIVVLMVMISSLLVLKKKMKASHLPPIELHEKSLTVVVRPMQKEEEVFDSLKPRTQASIIDKDKGADSSRSIEKIRNFSKPLLSKNGSVLEKLELSAEHMPLVEDADLCGGEVSPTDSGLQCDDFLSESQGEPSPIPMSFLPDNSRARHIDSDSLNSEQVIVQTETRDTGVVSVGSDPSDSGQSGEGYVVQALAGEDGGLQTSGDSVASGSMYNDGSVISSIGYVQMTTPDTDSGSGGHTSPYVPQAPTSNSGPRLAGSPIPSYVQQDVSEASQDGSYRLDNSTSGNSSCPSYVKQSEATENNL